MYLRATVPDKTWLRVKHDGWLVLPDGSDGYVLGADLYCGGKPYSVAPARKQTVLCVPVSEKDGIWSTVKGYGSGAEKSKQITAALTQCYGVSGEAFCKYVANRVSSLNADYAANAAKLREQITADIEFTADDGVVVIACHRLVPR